MDINTLSGLFLYPKNQTETESDVVGRDFMYQLQKTNERR